MKLPALLIKRPAPAAIVPAFLCCLGLVAGCGSPGAPQPPSLKIPAQVADLSASRSGDAVILHWTMPRRSTDRVLLAGDQRVTLCRNEHPGACHVVAKVLLQPAAPAQYTDTLPPELTHGELRLLTYTVELTNRSGHSAGSSNPAYSAAGAAPPSLGPVTAAAAPEGIVLQWHAMDASSPLIRLHRTRVLAAGEFSKPGPDETRTGVPQPVEQTLEARERPGPDGAGRVTDADAALDHEYRYLAERVVRTTLDGYPVELDGPASAADVRARDVFPPEVPQGVEAVADEQAGAIDVSWAANVEPDLAGYFVYRRPAQPPASPATRASGAEPLGSPAWRDTHVTRGVRYLYSVTAVDHDGNESAQSQATEEGLAAPQR